MNLYEKRVIEEERLFLSLCNSEDRQKLLRQIPLTYHDYLRLTYIMACMNLVYYEMKINEYFPEYDKARWQMLERHEEISSQYPDYYKDEEFDKELCDWLIKFCEQISDEFQQKRYMAMFGLE